MSKKLQERLTEFYNDLYLDVINQLILIGSLNRCGKIGRIGKLYTVPQDRLNAFCTAKYLG